MDSNYESFKPRSYRDLGAEARVQELRHFQEVLRKGRPITHVLLSEWASNSDSRSALLTGGVSGGHPLAERPGQAENPKHYRRFQHGT